MFDFILNQAALVGNYIGQVALALAQGKEGFTSAGITLAIYSGIMAGLYFGRRHAFRWFRRKFAVMVDYEVSFGDKDEDKAFDEVLTHIYSISPYKRHFELKRSFFRRGGSVGEERSFGINRGMFFLWVKNRPIWVSYSVDHKEHGIVRALKFRGYFIEKEIITDIIGEVKEAKKDNTRYRYLMLNTEDMKDSFLMTRSTRSPIAERSYYLPKRVKDIVDNAYDIYVGERKNFNDRGVMNKFNVLVYGPPGIGKSVIADYISQRLEKNILVPYMGASTYSVFLSARTAARLNSIVYIDEADSFLEVNSWNPGSGVFETRENSVSVTVLQSVLEGSLTIEDQVFVLTTNRPEKFGEAALRNSRMDLVLFMDYWIHEDIDGWFNYYYPGSEPVSYSFPSTYRFRTCDMAHLYKQYPNDFTTFVNEMRKLDVSLQEGYDKWNTMKTEIQNTSKVT